MNTAIQLQELTKYYGPYKGIENINLTVEIGKIHGFLGPNGAGKTTTLRILSGLLQPTSGLATILGEPVGSLEAKQSIGYLPSDFELYGYYTVKEYLDYIEHLRGEAPYRKELVSKFKLDQSRKTKELSRGNKQKVAIVQALMHHPDILIADEPTIGLDPLMQDVFDNVLHEYIKSNDKTVFISSHILSEVQRVCQEVTIIREGEVVSSGNVRELLSELPRKARITVKSGTDGKQVAEDINSSLSSQTDTDLVVIFDNIKEFMSQAATHDKILDVEIPSADLEEYFKAYYR